MRAGYYHPTARRNFLAVRNALTVLPLVATVALLAFVVPTPYWSMIAIGAGLVASGLGYCLPRFQVRWQGNRRVRRIERSLPDAADMLTMCITGGMTMHEALDRVSRELGMSHQDLALELRIIRRHTELGSLVHGLQHFARRIGTTEVQSLTTLLIQSERLGTDLARALEDYTDNLRRRRRQQAEERANRASVKMLFPIVLCLAPSVFILLLGPAALELRNFLVRERRPGGVLSQETLETVNTLPSLNATDR
jgi:tight adherence protein C